MVTVQTDKGTYSGRTAYDAVQKGFGRKARLYLYPVAYRKSYPGATVGFVELPVGRSTRLSSRQTYAFVARIVSITREAGE